MCERTLGLGLGTTRFHLDGLDDVDDLLIRRVAPASLASGTRSMWQSSEA